jgi:hypothetical protein
LPGSIISTGDQVRPPSVLRRPWTTSPIVFSKPLLWPQLANNVPRWKAMATPWSQS